MLKIFLKPIARACLLGVFLGGTGLGMAADADAGLRDWIKERREARKSKGSDSSNAVELQVDGQTREMLVYPPRRKTSKPGIVLVFHGGGGGGMDSIARQTGVHKLGTDFITVYPQASGNWNDGRRETADGPNDVKFVDAIVAHLTKEYGADPSKVFSTGLSNGGMMTHRLACERSDSVRAVATVVANFPAAYFGKCKPSRAVPVMMFNGTGDDIMKWGGGEIKTVKWLGLGVGGEVVSTPKTYDFYANMNGCDSGHATEAMPDTDESDGTRTERWARKGCKRGEVILFRVDGGDHGWPGSGMAMPRRSPGRDVDATQKIVAFFRRNGL